MSKYIPKGDKETVKNRAKGYCEYCFSKEEFCPDPFSMEYIIPLAKKGTNSIDNLANSCQGCNNLKYTATEVLDNVTGDFFPVYNPRKHIWSEHFRWSENFLKIIGISAIGRVTVELL
jgi:5-methylcytosine-specific restriction endonuclease McrA